MQPSTGNRTFSLGARMARGETGGARGPRLHWIVLGVLAGASLWCLVGAAVAAILTAWVVAAILLGAAVALAVITAVLVRPRRPGSGRRAVPADPPTRPDLARRPGPEPLPESPAAPSPDSSHGLPQR